VNFKNKICTKVSSIHAVRNLHVSLEDNYMIFHNIQLKHNGNGWMKYA